MPDPTGGGAIAAGVGSLMGGGAGLMSSLFGGGKGGGDEIENAVAQQMAMQRESLDLKRRMYDEAVARMAPWAKAGQATINYLPGLFGIPGYAKVDPTEVWRATPGYNWLFDEGVRARDKSAAARGTLYSGAQQKGLTTFGQGLADTAYKTNYLDPLFKISDSGQNAAALSGNWGQGYANSAGQDYGAMGNVLGMGGIAQYNAEQANLNNLMKSIGMIGGGLASPGFGKGVNYLSGLWNSAPSYSYGAGGNAYNTTGNMAWGGYPSPY